MNYKILSCTWKTPAQGHRLIGIVAIETDQHLMESQRTWKAYIGIVHEFPVRDGDDEILDATYVAKLGAPLSRQEAHGFFPQMDIKKYKDEN